MVAIAKFRSYDKNRDKKQHARLVILYKFLVILARKVSILGLSTEWGDRLFQSIIVRGTNETTQAAIIEVSEYIIVLFKPKQNNI